MMFIVHVFYHTCLFIFSLPIGLRIKRGKSKPGMADGPIVDFYCQLVCWPVCCISFQWI